MRWMEPPELLFPISKSKADLISALFLSVIISLIFFRLEGLYLFAIFIFSFLFCYHLIRNGDLGEISPSGRVIEIKGDLLRWGTSEDFEPYDPEIDHSINISYIKLKQIVGFDFNYLGENQGYKLKIETTKRQRNFTISKEFYCENRDKIKHALNNNNISNQLFLSNIELLKSKYGLEVEYPYIVNWGSYSLHFDCMIYDKTTGKKLLVDEGIERLDYINQKYKAFNFNYLAYNLKTPIIFEKLEQALYKKY